MYSNTIHVMISVMVFSMTTITITHGIERLSDCVPKKSYVHVNPDYRYTPYIVELHRCTGKTHSSSRNTVCVPKTYNNVSVLVQEFSKPGSRLMANHTSCQERCKHDASICNENESWDPRTCSCKCDIKGVKQCDKGFTWDPFRCGCICPKKSGQVNCGKYRKFSEDACGCVCKPSRQRKCEEKDMLLDPNKCICKPKSINTGAQSADCGDPDAIISKTGIVLVAVAEAILIIGGYVLWKRYSKKCKNKQSTPWHDISTDYPQSNTPTIEILPGQTVLYPLKYNNNKTTTTKTSTSSSDVLIGNDVGSSEHLNNDNKEYGDWRASCGSTIKV